MTYPDAMLLSLTGFSAPRTLTLTELRAMASQITDYYRKQGYFLAQAYLPPQDIRNGAVTIAVVEGQYGAVTLRNTADLSTNLLNDLLAGLDSGDTIAIQPLEHRLLLLSDIPGVDVKSTLVPGASIGTSDLIVDVAPGKRVTGSVDADNHGNRYTGANRLGAAVNINNPFGFGDVLSMRAVRSDASMLYGRVSYQAPLGRTRAGVAYSHMDYRLGKDFASLDAHGTATIASLFASYPLIRSRSHNLYVVANLDSKKFRDKVYETVTVADKKARVAMLGLDGNVRDSAAGGGLTAYGLTWSAGDLDVRGAAALAADAATARSDGDYNKLSFYASRLQSVTATVSLSAAISGQVASKNLDASEKMGLGGAGAVRAFPSGEAYGDQGYVLTLEARKLLPRFSDRVPGQMQLIGFVDTGTVMLNKNPWAAGSNRRTLSGAGFGLNWVDNNNFVVKAHFAHKLGNEVATSAPDANNRFWLQGVKYF